MKKRILPFALALALSMGLTVPAALADEADTAEPAETSAPAEAAASVSTVQVTVSALNVRKGPGVSYGVTSVVYQGDVLNIVEIKYDWGQLENGGWIYLPNYTKTVSADAAEPADEPAASVDAVSTVEVTTYALNVRSGPGVSNGVISAVYKGDVLDIVEIKYDWGKLVSGGWIYLPNYTKAVSAGEAESAAPAETESTASAETESAAPVDVVSTVEVTAYALNVRSGPGVSNGVISVVYKGDVLNIVEIKYDWGKLENGGWIYLPQYTKTVEAPADSEA